jgi:hypothetical protein
MPKRKFTTSRRTLMQCSAILGTGIAVGALTHTLPGNQAVIAATSDATATREAELAELHALQTEVAKPRVCTPAATETPAPTSTATRVPISPTGLPLPYGKLWTIVVLGISPAPISTDLAPSGKFMQITLSVSHSSRTSEYLEVADFLLTDDAGRFSVPLPLSNPLMIDLGWQYELDPGVTRGRAIIFDVAADAGDSFILESNADPTFRVGMTIEQRG